VDRVVGERDVKPFWVAFCLVLFSGLPQASAIPPPIFDPDQALDMAWRKPEAEAELERCSAKTKAAHRFGTVWVDVIFYSRRPPTFTLRASPGLVAADKGCVHAVVARQVLPTLARIPHHVDYQPISTKEVALGGATPYLPPFASFLSEWSQLVKSPTPSRRARLERQVKPVAVIAPDGCLLVRQETRQTSSRKEWLASAGDEVPHVWQPLVDRFGKASALSEATMFLVDGALLLAGKRTDRTVRYRVEEAGHARTLSPQSWSRDWETYCRRPFDQALVRDVDRGVDDIATCVAGSGVERLSRPVLESPKDRKLHSVSLAPTRYCGLDEAGAIICCGIRGEPPPQGSFVGLSLDDRYACAIRANGELTCWGPPDARGTSPPGRFTRISLAKVGGAYCALGEKGGLACRGVGSWVGPPPAGPFVDISVTLRAAHAVAVDGTLVTWGDHPGRRFAGAVRVAANDCQVCAITQAGMVECMDQKGERLPVVGPYAAFAPGCPGGCGLRQDGSPACDGAGSSALPADIAAGKYAEITWSEGRFCATSLEGRVVCWGKPWPGDWLGRRMLTGATP
jgi:hypothetical protein